MEHLITLWCCIESPGGTSEPVSNTAHAQLSSADAAAEVDLDDAEAAHMHRLQRQDAKSRKTFKIKRNRSTLRASSAAVARSATVKVSGRSERATGRVTT